MVLSAGLCDTFDFVAFGDACALDVLVGCEDEFVCDGFLYAERVVLYRGACAFSYVANCQIDSSLWCDVDG